MADEQLYATLNLLLPSSPLLSLLSSATPPTGSYVPFQAPEYPSKSLAEIPKLPQPLAHPLHLLSSLSLLLHLLIRTQVIVHTTVEAEVKARRQRLGSGPEKEVRKKVEAEVLGGPVGMGMVDLLREVSGHPNVEDAVRRDVEVKEFNFWKKLVGVLRCVFFVSAYRLSTDGYSMEVSTETGKASVKKADDKSGFPPAPLFDTPEHSIPTKGEALSRANGLADGFILLGLTGTGVEEGWHWVLNGKDEPTIRMSFCCRRLNTDKQITI
jgi:superkiller protein 3